MPQASKTSAVNHPSQSTKPTSGNDGMSRKEFARHIGVSSEAVRQWEKGERKPSKGNADLFDRWEVVESIWYPIPQSQYLV